MEIVDLVYMVLWDMYPSFRLMGLDQQGELCSAVAELM